MSQKSLSCVVTCLCWFVFELIGMVTFGFSGYLFPLDPLLLWLIPIIWPVLYLMHDGQYNLPTFRFYIYQNKQFIESIDIEAEDKETAEIAFCFVIDNCGMKENSFRDIFGNIYYFDSNAIKHEVIVCQL